MNSSDTPSRIQLPFADSGAKNVIPVASQIPITPGAASYTDGFPPLTMLPIAAGGIPPFGTDVNGIFNIVTAIQRWQSAGGLFKFDAIFASAIGGYPKGAVLIKADGTGMWINQTEANSTNPDSGGAGWMSVMGNDAGYSTYGANTTIPATDNGKWIFATANNVAFTLPLSSSLPAGATIKVSGNGYSNVNVQRQGGSDTITPGLPGGTITSLPIGAFDTAYFINLGTGTWYLLGGETHFKYSSSFAASLASNGWRQLPSGDIEQWGSVVTSGSADVAVNFPIAFPTGVYNIQVTAVLIGSGVYGTHNGQTANGFNIAAWVNNTSRAVATCQWRAIGK